MLTRYVYDFPAAGWIGSGYESELIQNRYRKAVADFSEPVSTGLQIALQQAHRTAVTQLNSSEDLGTSVRSAILTRLEIIFDGEEWEVGDELPRLSSFSGLLRFLTVIEKVRAPEISVTRSGNFTGSWFTDANESVTIEFVEGGVVNSMIFMKNEFGSQFDEIWVKTSLSSISEKLRNLEAIDILR